LFLPGYAPLGAKENDDDAKTNVLENSFFHRIVGRWNILPFETRSVSSVNIFKSKLFKENVKRFFKLFYS